MVSQQEIVKQQRQSIASARQQARAIATREKISKSKLLKRGLAEREKSKSLTERRKQASKYELSSISSQEREFESQVARVAPTLAQPKYKAEALQTATKAISGSLISVKSQLTSARATLERARGKGKQLDKYMEKVAALEAQERVYSKALKGSQAEIISGHYSGQTSSLAHYEGQKAEQPFERAQAKRRWAEKQGFKTYRELQSAIKAQTLPGISSGVRVEQARNTYDPSTGVYIDKSGQGMSMAKAPAGATIIGQPFLSQSFSSDKLKALGIKQEYLPKYEIQQLTTKAPTISKETKRYQDLGYSKSDASKLARESLARGGFTFTKEGAREITRPDIVTKARDVKTYITEKAKDTISYFKDDKVKTKEIYSPSVSGFVTASAMGQGTDIFLRGTTEKERKKMDELTPKQQIFFGVEKKSESIFTADTSFVDTKSNEAKQLSVSLEKLSKENINENKEWIGSEKDLEKYNRQIERYNEISTIKTGLFKYTRDVPIESFNFGIRPVASTRKAIFSTTGSILGGIAEKKYGEKGRVVGEFVGETGLGIASYFTPIGATTFVGEFGEYGIEAYKTKKEIGKLTPELKTEGVYFGAALITGGVIKGGSSLIKGRGLIGKGLLKLEQLETKSGITGGIGQKYWKFQEKISPSQKTLNIKQVKELELSLKELSGKPIRYVEVVDEGTGMVKLTGIQESGKFERAIEVVGKIEDIGGKKLIPIGTGTSRTIGEIGGKSYIGVDKFLVGSKGVSVPYKQIGSVEWSKTLTKSVYEPISSASLVKRKFGLFDFTSDRLLVSKALKEGKKGGTTIIDISPGDTFKIKENLFLSAEKKGIGDIGITYVVPKKETGVIVMEGGGKKTPFAKTFGDLKQVSQPPKIVDTRVLKKGLVDIKPSVSIEPKLDIKPVSAYTGTGLYERTEEVSYSPISLPSQISRNLQPTTTSVIQKDVIDIKETQISKLDMKLKDIKIREYITPKTKLIERIKEVQKQKQEPRLVSLLRTAQVQKPIQREVFKQPTRTIQPTRPKPPEPKIKIPVILSTPSLAKRLAKKAEEGMFEAVGFRFGEEVSLGVAKTQTAAEEKLSSFLRKTLSASGYISKDKIKLKASELKTFGTGEFRVGKTSPFLVVEKKAKRLRRGETGFQIQAFRFGKSSKKSMFGI